MVLKSDPGITVLLKPVCRKSVNPYSIPYIYYTYGVRYYFGIERYVNISVLQYTVQVVFEQ